MTNYMRMGAATLTAWLVACAAPAPSFASEWHVFPLDPPADSYQSQGVAVFGALRGGNVEGFTGHAVLWRGAGEPVTYLTPAGSGGSTLTAMWAGRQVGYVAGPRAAVWTGSPESFVDLSLPQATYAGSYAYAVRGGQIVGYSNFRSAGLPHAILWSGINHTPIDLHNPDVMVWSRGYATDGEYQGGVADMIVGPLHAALWRGSPESFVDLHPAGATSSMVQGMAPGVQVGNADFPGRTVGARWRGTAASFADLTPPYAVFSDLYATDGVYHVGNVIIGGVGHAGIWMTDTPTGFVDLAILVGTNISGSTANGVYHDARGIYVVGQVRLGEGALRGYLWIYSNATAGTGEGAAPNSVERRKR